MVPWMVPWQKDEDDVYVLVAGWVVKMGGL